MATGSVKHSLSSAIILLAAFLTGCASEPPRQHGAPAAQKTPVKKQTTAKQKPSSPKSASGENRTQSGQHKGLDIAAGMLGTPYRYGGASPRGFDCSGLVYFAYRKAGIPVPRTTGAQLHYAHPVHPSRLRPGDLLFFRLTSRTVSHVGIYAGDGRFIHAPSRGKRVSYASLDNPYWQQRIVAAGRF